VTRMTNSRSDAQRRLFSEVRGRVILRSSPIQSSRKFARVATWQMCSVAYPCYRGCVVQPGGSDESRPFAEGGRKT
jgi:hypothetical protein